MNTIKFRVWDKVSNTFSYLNIIDALLWLQNGDVMQTSDDKDIDFSKSIVPQQFTNLIDLNGTEIYEGDIVRLQINDNPEDLQWELYPVVFDRGCFFMSDNLVMPLYDYIINNYVDVEVIGNIFENPELLCKEK